MAETRRVQYDFPLGRIEDRFQPYPAISGGHPTMKTWRKPKILEIAVGTEINAYACAGL